MPAPVKTDSNCAPADIRAFCARYGLTYAELARRIGCSRSYVSQVARADLTGRPVSGRALERIRRIALEALWDRNQPQS